MQIPCVYLPGPAPAVSVANSTAGVHATEHPSLVLSIVCASTCTAIGILCHGIPYVWYAHEHVWDVQRREIYAKLSLIQHWRLWRLPHIPSISLSCVSCIFCVLYVLFVFSRQCWENEGRGNCHTALLPRNQIPYILPVNIHPPDSVLHTL